MTWQAERCVACRRWNGPVDLLASALRRPTHWMTCRECRAEVFGEIGPIGPLLGFLAFMTGVLVGAGAVFFYLGG